MGGRQKSRKEANGGNKRMNGKEGMQESVMKVMNLKKLFADIKSAKRLILIEDHPGYAREIKGRVMELNPIIEILAARTLEDALKLKFDVDKDTVVLSDYNFPITDGLGMMPQPLARKTYEELADFAKAYAIVTLAESLEPVDMDLECFRVGKNEFIGEKRAEEMRKKKVIVASDTDFMLELVHELKRKYPGYVFAAPGLERNEIIPIEIVVLISSRKKEEKEFRRITRKFSEIFGRQFDACIHKSTIYAEDMK